MGEFPSGQRGQTVNLLSLTSMVRIHLPPPKKETSYMDVSFFGMVFGKMDSNRAAADGRKKHAGGMFFSPRLANPSSPTKKKTSYMDVFFLVWYSGRWIRTGRRPMAAKNMPGACFLARGLRIHLPPPKIGKFERACRFLLLHYSLFTFTSIDGPIFGR